MAIYARYSSDMQSAASITDQVRLCRKLAAERGWQVVEVFADEALSGASHLRPGYQALQQAAMAGRFDVLVAEALDRLSRDQEHIAGLHKRMRYLGVEIFTKAEGAISEMHIGLGGTMSALYLRNLAEKTHRGLEGRVKQGKSAGGISYGYRLDRQPLPDGTFATGDRIIDETQAAIVRRIFTEYDRGLSARSIAIGLNRDGIAPPRSGGKGSGTWSFSTISGNWKRGTGILNNDLYRGLLVWNRQRFIKDPDTGKRQARLNPPDEWITEEVPHLRIIDDALWAQVKQRQGAIREDILTERAEDPGAPKIERAHRRRYLLSGLLTCGCCGAGYIMISATRYGCSAARNRGTCSNKKTIARKDVETRVLNGLQTRLMHPDLIREYITTWQQEMQTERQETLAARSDQERRLAKVRRDIENIVTAITEGMFHPSMKTKMDALEGERAELEAKLAALPDPEPVAIHPGLAETYARKVADLATALNDPEARAQAADLLRGLIENVKMMPDPDAPNGHRIELVGELGAILSLYGSDIATNAKARSGATGIRQVTMVAGTGFEPVTFRL
ncbi:recombinase family protein [Roseinatronobacter sp.]|uniref:recombinase family protein n=1 Tax=Roseinatronobacter sp. TaxID=1945755 RepID=UPI0025EDD92F|nr:recombinase family protein [Roseibaca sp.]